jgi:hypothetical protein
VALDTEMVRKYVKHQENKTLKEEKLGKFSEISEEVTHLPHCEVDKLSLPGVKSKPVPLGAASLIYKKV